MIRYTFREAHFMKKKELRENRLLTIAFCYSGSLCDTIVTTIDGQQFDTRELDGDRGMSMVADWSLPIFEIAEKHQNTVLSRVSDCVCFPFLCSAQNAAIMKYRNLHQS